MVLRVQWFFPKMPNAPKRKFLHFKNHVISDEVSGSGFDWVKGEANVPIVHLFELRDVGQYGFLLPPEQIIPNNEEVMAALIEMDRVTRQIGYYAADSGFSFKINVMLLLASMIFAIA